MRQRPHQLTRPVLSPMRHAVICLTLVAALLAPATAHAQYPVPGMDLQAHDHETIGRNWHVQFLVHKKDRTKVETLVLYAEMCDASILRTKIPISPTGEISTWGALKRNGGWELTATVTAPDTITGTARIVKGGCDTGPMPFTAQTPFNHQHTHGRIWPDFASATLPQIRQVQQLRRNAWKAANTLFPTYDAAVARGYQVNPNFRPRVTLFHIRNYSYIRDDVIFSSKRPESLVYWWRPDGDHVLVGFMYYVPGGKRVPWGGPIPIYHQHFGKGASDPMTHLWLTNDPLTAWANCLPVRELEYAHLGFRHTGQPSAFGDAGAACPA